MGLSFFSIIFFFFFFFALPRPTDKKQALAQQISEARDSGTVRQVVAMALSQLLCEQGCVKRSGTHVPCAWAQDLANALNSCCQWNGLSQVPKER